MKYPAPRFLLAATTLLAASTANAATATKTGTAGSTDLTDTTGVSWSGGTGTGGSPTSADTATWDTTSLGAGLTVGSDVTWGGINVSGAQTAIDITGAGKITTGNITLTGAQTLSIANAIVLSGNSTYTITNVNGTSTAPDLTISGVISGNFGITTTGPSANNPAATIVLSGANTYSGDTSIRRYTTVSVSNIGNIADTASALGTGQIKLFAGELTYTGNGETTDKVINFSSLTGETGGTITNNGTGTLTFSSAAISTLAGSSGVTLGGTGNGSFVGITQSITPRLINFNKQGTGTWTLTGSTNLNGGAINLKEGVLQLGGGDNRLTGVTATSGLTLGFATGNTSGKLILGSVGVAGVTDSKSDLTVSALQTAGTGTANAIVGGHTSVSTLTVNQATGTSTFSGKLGGTGTNENNLALTKSGAGTLTLGNTGNTFTGTISVTAGTLNLGSGNGVLGNASNGITLNGGTLGTIAAADGLSYSVNLGTRGISLGVSGGTFNPFSTTGGVGFTVGGVISGTAGTGALTKTGGGFLVLNGANSYTGGTTISGGPSIATTNAAIHIGNDSAFGTSAVTFTNTGSINGLRFTGNNTVANDVALSATAGLTNRFLVDSGRSAALSGIISGGSATSVLEKASTGTLTLSGANTYTGGTTISAGTLVTGNAGALGSGSVSVNTVGATLKVGNGTVNTVTLGSGANLAVADGAFIQLGALNAASLDATAGTNGVITLAGGGAYNFSASGKLDLNGILDGAIAGSHTYNLIVGSGTVTNELQLANISGYDIGLITLNSFANGTLTFTAVPEPSTYGLIGAGALAAVAMVRRRKQAGKAA